MALINCVIFNKYLIMNLKLSKLLNIFKWFLPTSLSGQTCHLLRLVVICVNEDQKVLIDNQYVVLL